MEDVDQPEPVHIELDGSLAILSLDRPTLRNALDDRTVASLERFFSAVPEQVETVILQGLGRHFSVGLDLQAMGRHSAAQAMHHSRTWQRVFDRIQFCRVPVIALLRGAVFGGGLEMACACHIRIAEKSAMYRLPECQLGIFVGAGGSVRVMRLTSLATVTDMLLTGRTLDARQGHDAGLSQYLVGTGEAMPLARELAQKISRNTAMGNFGVIQLLPRIAEQSEQAGLLSEAMMLAIAQSEPDTMQRLARAVDATRKNAGG